MGKSTENAKQIANMMGKSTRRLECGEGGSVAFSLLRYSWTAGWVAVTQEPNLWFCSGARRG